MDVTGQILIFIGLWVWKLDSEEQTRAAELAQRSSTQEELTRGIPDNPCESTLMFLQVWLPTASHPPY